MNAPMHTYQLHPLCTFFPRIDGAEFSELVEDIKRHGLRNPIVLLDGMILDGGNRYRACMEAGAVPVFVEYDGEDPVGFVLSANLHRRHLTEGQRSAIVSAASDWAKAQTQGRPKKSGNLAGLSTVNERAARAGTSERTQRMADQVAKADPELAQKVAAGEVSLPKAVEQITGKRPGKRPGKSADKQAVRIADLEGEVQALKDELELVRDGASEAVAQAETAQAVLAGDEAKTILQLKGYIKTLESQRDDLLNQNAQLKREVKALRRRLGE